MKPIEMRLFIVHSALTQRRSWLSCVIWLRYSWNCGEVMVGSTDKPCKDGTTECPLCKHYLSYDKVESYKILAFSLKNTFFVSFFVCFFALLINRSANTVFFVPQRVWRTSPTSSPSGQRSLQNTRSSAVLPRHRAGGTARESSTSPRRSARRSLQPGWNWPSSATKEARSFCSTTMVRIVPSGRLRPGHLNAQPSFLIFGIRLCDCRGDDVHPEGQA